MQFFRRNKPLSDSKVVNHITNNTINLVPPEMPVKKEPPALLWLKRLIKYFLVPVFVVLAGYWLTNQPQTPQKQSTAAPTQAPTEYPPVLVRTARGLASIIVGGDVASRQVVAQPSIVPFTDEWTTLEGEMNVAEVSPATLTIAIVGNWNEDLSIVDFRMNPKCGAPYDGTYFAIPSQGGESVTELGFNLDSPQGDFARIVENGRPTDRRYFDEFQITIGRGEVETFVFTLTTNRQHCTVSPELTIASNAGTFNYTLPMPADFQDSITAAPSNDNEIEFKATYVGEFQMNGSNMVTVWRPGTRQEVLGR